MINHQLKIQVSDFHSDTGFNARQHQFLKELSRNRDGFFFYALIREMTFLIKRKSKERIEIIEAIFSRISKVPMVFLYIIQIFGKGNTNFEIFFKLFF
jgi:hypothetical protein